MQSGRRAFFSYCIRDMALALELRAHLRALERGERLTIWRDRENITAGDDWEDALFTAMDASNVLLAFITPEWANSKWCTWEWEQAGRVGALRIGVLGRPYALASDPIGKLQVIRARDDRAVCAPGRIDGPDGRHEEWAHVIAEIERALGAHPARAPASPGMPRAPIDRQTHAELPSRTLQVTWNADRLQSADGGGRPLGAPRQATREQLVLALARTRAPDLDRLAGLHADASRGLAAEDACRVGVALADWLFGTGEARDALFVALFGTGASQHPGPRLHPVRLRLALSDTTLAGLPWSTLAETDGGLVDAGWTVEHSAPSAATPFTTGLAAPIVLPNPARVLIVASLGAPELEAATHIDALLHLASTLWGAQAAVSVRIVGDPGALADELERFQPHVVHVYAEATADGAGVSIVHDGARRTLRLTELVGHLPPSVVVLHLALVTRGRPVAVPAGWTGLTVVPGRACVGPALADSSRAWFHEVFAEGVHPIVAATRLGRADGHPWRVHAPHDALRIGLPYLAEMKRAPWLHLDRESAKRDALKLCDFLLKQDARLVACAVGMGASEHHPEKLPDQIHADLSARLRERAVVWRVNAEWPESIGKAAPTEAAFTEACLYALGATAATLPEYLRAEADKKRGAKKTWPVLLLLEWGVGGAARDRPVDRAWVTAWHAATVRTLLGGCPRNMRIVSFVVVETPERNHDGLRRLAIADGATADIERIPLHAVGNVDEDDLRYFLLTRGNSTCPVDFAPDVARALHETTGGAFGPLCETIERANRDGWTGLAARGRALRSDVEDETVA